VYFSIIFIQKGFNIPICSFAVLQFQNYKIAKSQTVNHKQKTKKQEKVQIKYLILNFQFSIFNSQNVVNYIVE